MNVIFISPHFPLHFYHFCQRLKGLGAKVLGIGDCPYEHLAQEVRESVTEYYYLPSLEDYEQVMRATAFFTFKYGKMDYVESQNEYWLELEARLRTDFNISTGWKSDELKTVKHKSLMKEGYKRAKVKTARYTLVDSKEAVETLVGLAGFPIIIKPDNGVGASRTFKIDDEEELHEVLESIPIDGSFIAEEFVPGHIETFDGITNSRGDIVFYVSQVMAVTPLGMLNGSGENVSYTQNVQEVDDLREAGFRTVKAFGLKNRFFHFEFFRLDANKKGLGRKGDVLGLEVNMRAPGGYIPDKMNFAYNVDVYQIWAETLVKGDNVSFPHLRFQRYVTHFGLSEKVEYLHTEEAIRERYGKKILLEKTPPSSISGGMGNKVYLLEADSVAELEEQANFILMHSDGTKFF